MNLIINQMKKVLFLLMFCSIISLPSDINTQGNHPTLTYEDVNREEYLKVKEYLDILGYLESSGRYDIRKGQYWGKYQLGDLARTDIGLSADFIEFSSNENLQDISAIKYLLVNEKYLGGILEEYSGKNISGIVLTRESMLAGAHLVGYKNLKIFLQSEGLYIPEDGNGTPITKYLEIFQTYNSLDLLKAKEFIKSVDNSTG
jgi:hypothetical protein